jgi:hypothetical protein
MLDPIIEREILTQLDKLSLEQQLQVLNFAKSLAGTMPVGVPGKELLHLAGTISTDDAKLMREAIEEACEQVDEAIANL